MIRAFSISILEFYCENIKNSVYHRYFFFGLLVALGFAPFHLPGLAILGIALFYNGLTTKNPQSPFLCGLVFGLGFFTLGISWVYVSIHDYGHLHSIIAAFITFVFLLYLALFPAITAAIFSRLAVKPYTMYSGLLFSSLWVLSEYLRATFLSGFPWLLLGFGQFDSPLKFILPILGVFGAGFMACFAATLLPNSVQAAGLKRYLSLVFFVLILLLPLLFKNDNWVKESNTPISVGVVQTNLSMRDKWDEALFWELLERYQKETEQLLGTQLIVLPESAIPLPATYISDFISSLRQKAKKAGSAILLGIPQATAFDENYYFNTMLGLGKAKGSYLKQHLVPFGEYIPEPFQYVSRWLGIPDANIMQGKKNQSLLRVHNHPIASLICYELAYGNLLRQQLPIAEWIVSISDDGWFGHSLAMYQQLQMAQVLSLQTARYQVVSNNDGLSSVINTQGKIMASLPAYSAGVLQANIFAASGNTPWVTFGDFPILLFSVLITLISAIYKIILVKVRAQPIAAKHKRRYPYPPY